MTARRGLKSSVGMTTRRGLKSSVGMTARRGLKSSVGMTARRGLKSSVGMTTRRGLKSSVGMTTRRGLKSSVGMTKRRGLKSSVGMTARRGLKSSVGMTTRRGLKSSVGMTTRRGLKSSVGMSDSGETRRANGEERMAKSETRRATSNHEREGLMSVNHCHHIKVDGVFCQTPALHGRDYCHFHLQALGRRMRMARERARREPHRLVLPLLEDMNAVQVARMQVLDALASGLLEERRAGLLLYGLQQASTDLRSLTAAPSLGVYDESDTAPRAEDYPGFEEEFGLPKDLDLTKPPEVAFPAAAATEVKVEPSPYRSKPFDRDEIAPEDVELEQIFRTQGPEAYQRREKELTRQA